MNNPKKLTPAALNIGIQKSQGEIIIRMDAHSSYERDYINKCVKYLTQYDADNVGGICITVPREDTFWAKAVSLSLMTPFGVGNSYFRIQGVKDAKLVDTVPFGYFHKSVFERIGLFDESYHRNEDIEFNKRLRNSSGKVLLVPEIEIKYYTRSDLKSFAKHHFDNG